MPHNKENMKATARMNRSANKKRLQRLLESPARNLYDPEAMRQQGFAYYAIGRGDG